VVLETGVSCRHYSAPCVSISTGGSYPGGGVCDRQESPDRHHTKVETQRGENPDCQRVHDRKRAKRREREMVMEEHDEQESANAVAEGKIYCLY
jgi:hypothetical protein